MSAIERAGDRIEASRAHDDVELEFLFACADACFGDSF